MDSRVNFYKKLILKYLNKDSKILVVGSGLNDVQLFKEAGFNNVAFSNFNGTEVNGIKFKKIDINNIEEKNESYDYVIAHACIHHCSKPHSGILEMYRVSKKGILVIEARDSFLMNIMIKLKLAEEYELSAISCGDEFGDHGGVDNTKIPNFVFRWTEREVQKLINSYNPEYQHIIKFDYAYDCENILKKIKNKPIKNIISYICLKLILILNLLLKRQGNLFSFFIYKNKSKELKKTW